MQLFATCWNQKRRILLKIHQGTPIVESNTAKLLSLFFLIPLYCLHEQPNKQQQQQQKTTRLVTAVCAYFLRSTFMHVIANNAWNCVYTVPCSQHK